MDTGVVIVLTAIVGAAGWLLTRMLTPTRRSESYELASKILDVRQKLVAAGFEPEEIEQFVTTLESDRTGARASAALRAIAPPATAMPETIPHPSALDTTAAMGVRTEARLRVLDAEIEQVLVDIEILASQRFQQSGHDLAHYDQNHVRKIHRAWNAYRTRAAQSAAEDYAGGTIGGLVWVAEEVRLAENFLKDMIARLEELKR